VILTKEIFSASFLQGKFSSFQKRALRDQITNLCTPKSVPDQKCFYLFIYFWSCYFQCADFTFLFCTSKSPWKKNVQKKKLLSVLCVQCNSKRFVYIRRVKMGWERWQKSP